MTAMKTKILIAEQNPAAIEWIQHELKTGIINCIVEIVSSKKAYEAALHHFKPDLILSNDTFPSFDGMALFRMKQKLTPQTPFIFVVPAITVEKAIALIQIGVNDIVFKTDLNSLTSKVNSALKKSRKTRETYQTEAERTIMPRYSITESKTTKEKSDPITASQESLQDLGKILDFSMDLICSCDENGKFIWVNKASERILGYRPEELIGRLYIDLLFPEDAETSVHTDFDSSNGGQLPIFENRFRHSNGSTVYLQWSAVWDDVKKMSYYTGRDITAKKNVEKAFEIERRRFSNLFSHAPSSMAILKGPNHVFELANELYLQLIDTKDIIGKPVKEVLPELETQGIFEILDTVYKTGETFSANEMLIEFNRSGNEKPEDSYLNFICQAHRDTDNNIDGILVFANDVTEQVLSRKKIEEREKMYKELIYKLPVATYSCDHKGRIVIYNKAAVALWGRKPEIGKDLWYDSWKSNAAKNNPEPLSFCSLSTALTEEDSNPSKQIIIERPNGDKRYVLPYPVPFRDAEGQITGAVIVLADITEMKLAQKELKKSEKKYRYLFDNNPMPMWVIDLVTFKFLDVNKMAILQYGYSRDEFLSMTALDIRPSNDKNHFIKCSDPSEINRSNYNRGKWNHLRKDGSVFPVEIIAHDIMYEGSRARLILSNDISDRTKAEINLEKRNKELLKTNSELDKFVYSVSHDLRSPLTSILGLLSFIETESREPDTVTHAEMIHSSINRLDDFIKNILSYSRNKRTGLEVEKISIKETLSEVVNSLQSTRDAKGIHYEIAVQEQQPFYTDRLRFNTILENLISNAIKYQKKEESGRSVKIAGHSDPENLHLTITDNGIGIAPAYHQKIYDMFFRLSGKKEGSGIGLYIVKDAIEILQGSIAIQSEEGIGTTFIITLKNLKP
ncbi:PAS domain S-box protein [Flavobacterium circumlabens]|uniref:histidine kinase n=2 Tax=Flavobacterium circumlabens TaxID=2133765 RepID=A0A4Y7U7E9_9FLAO|nr:PAS domain S-box-containing protein [Flavobacterium circumlabens]TEB42345.1 PAS domain S-box protein [Flavobacterium circumlabens]